MLSPDKELRPHVEASQNYRFLSPTQALLDQTFWMRDEVFLQAVLEQASRGFRCSLKFENHCSWAGRIKGRTGAKAGRCFSCSPGSGPAGGRAVESLLPAFTWGNLSLHFLKEGSNFLT